MVKRKKSRKVRTIPPAIIVMVGIVLVLLIVAIIFSGRIESLGEAKKPFKVSTAKFLSEKCDGLDNDFDSAIDEGCDTDHDGYCMLSKEVVGLPPTCPHYSLDCNDINDSTFAVLEAIRVVSAGFSAASPA